MTITEQRFASGTTGNNVLTFAAGTNRYYTPVVVKGEIKGFDFTTNTAGSLFLLQSGTDQIVYSNVAPSGTAWQRVIPAQFTVGTTAGSIAGAFHAGITVHEPLLLAFSGAGASSSGVFAVRYAQ